MNKNQLFKFIKQQDKPVLIELLQRAFEEMDTNQIRSVFGKIAEKIPPSRINGKELLTETQRFRKDSLAGRYYAPFDIDSKNYTHIPEETEEWFERLNDLLVGCMRLSQQGDHRNAIDCFAVLYDLIDKMENGEEIVFADEYGSWMIPGDERLYIKAYLFSLATVETPEGFTSAAIPMIRRDSHMSLSNKVYASAIIVANKEQKAHLTAEVERQNIRTKPNW